MSFRAIWDILFLLYFKKKIYTANLANPVNPLTHRIYTKKTRYHFCDTEN